MPIKFKDMLSASKKKVVGKSGFAVIAPMWTDADATKGDVFYHVYDRATERLSDDKVNTSYVMTLAAEDVMTYGGLSDVHPSWVMVVTWVDQLPRASYNPLNDKVMCYRKLY